MSVKEEGNCYVKMPRWCGAADCIPHHKKTTKQKYSTRRKWETLSPASNSSIRFAPKRVTRLGSSMQCPAITQARFKALSAPFIPEGITELVAWHCQKHIQALWEHQWHRHTTPNQGKAVSPVSRRQRCASLTLMSGAWWTDKAQRWLQKQNQVTGALVTTYTFQSGQIFHNSDIF